MNGTWSAEPVAVGPCSVNLSPSSFDASAAPLSDASKYLLPRLLGMNVTLASPPPLPPPSVPLELPPDPPLDPPPAQPASSRVAVASTAAEAIIPFRDDLLNVNLIVLPFVQ